MVRVLGIDPGLRLTGYGLVEQSAIGSAPRLLEAGVIRLKASRELEPRLLELAEALRGLAAELGPSHLAVEKLYAHYKHPRTAILMGHARGVILLAGAEAKLPTLHLPSTEVKRATTGHGHASKGQIQESVRDLFSLASVPEPPDVADAIAIALTGCRRATSAGESPGGAGRRG